MIRPGRRPRPFAALVAAVALCASLPALAAQVKDVRVGSHPKFTRIVFELDGRAGYQVERGGTDAAPEIKITIDASSSARVLRAIGDVRGVKVDAGTKARAHITLSDPNLRVHEMMLADPPRIVIDLHKPETAVAATAKPKAEAKPETRPAAKPEPKEVAKTPVETPKPEAKPAPKPEVKEIAKAEVKESPKAEAKEAPKAEPKEAPKPEAKEAAAPKAITPPAPVQPTQPPAIEPAKPKTEPEQAAAPAIVPPPTAAPTLPTPPHDPREFGPPAPASPPTPEGVAELPAATPEPPAPPAAVAPVPTPPRAEPAPAAKPVTQAPAPEPGGSFTDHLGDPMWLGGIAAVVLGLGAIGIVIRRRRALPNDLDVTAIAEEVERSGESPVATRIPSGGFAMGDDQPPARSEEATTFASLFDKPAQETEPVVFAPPRPSAPVAPEMPSPLAVEAEDSLFDDAGEMPGEPASEGDAPMNQEMDLPVDRRTSPPAARMGGSAAPSPSASPDITRMLQDMERRIATLEARLDESNEAREKLERQVAAQSEELRVQRAAIARTQRALRTMTRGDEDKATEPALRDGDTQAKTRVTP